MRDTYPRQNPDDEPGSSGRGKVHGIVYRGMRQVFDRDPSGVMPNPNSVNGQDALDRLDSLKARDVDGSHAAALAGIARIDSSRRAEAEALEEFNELAAIMEEAPGA